MIVEIARGTKWEGRSWSDVIRSREIASELGTKIKELCKWDVLFSGSFRNREIREPSGNNCQIGISTKEAMHRFKVWIATVGAIINCRIYYWVVIEKYGKRFPNVHPHALLYFKSLPFPEEYWLRYRKTIYGWILTPDDKDYEEKRNEWIAMQWWVMNGKPEISKYNPILGGEIYINKDIGKSKEEYQSEFAYNLTGGRYEKDKREWKKDKKEQEKEIIIKRKYQEQKEQRDEQQSISICQQVEKDLNL